MDKIEQLNKLEELTLSVYMDLNILHNALYCDYDDLDISAVSNFI